jgi:uncharacterized membrane protein
MSDHKPRPHSPSTVSQRNIRVIAGLEREALRRRSLGERVSDVIAVRSGTPWMVLIHVVWFGGWILVNTGLVPFLKPFDPFPFGFLTLVVSLEAIFLSLFLLISQNGLTRQAEKRAHLDLQVNLLIETEMTKTLVILNRICEKLAVDLSDEPELTELYQDTDLRRLAHSVERQIPDATDPESQAGRHPHAPPHHGDRPKPE